jgi:hypothetical protein
MKISYILQLKDFFIIFIIGFAVGILYEIINIPSRIKKILILQILIDVVFSLILYVVFLIMINLINLGEFRTFLLVGYTLGIFIERISIGKLFAKGTKKVYNYIVSKLKMFSNTKLGKALLK